MDHELPVVGARQGPPGVLRARARRHGGGARPRSTRSAPTSAAACPSASPRSGSSARATARSTTRSARRRAALRRAASTASPAEVDGDVVIVEHRPDHPGPADRHEHHRPGGRRPALRQRRALGDRTDHMSLASTASVATVDRTIGLTLAVLVVWPSSSTSSSTSCAPASPRSAPRSSSRRTASRTSTTRSSRARSSTARSPSGSCSSSSVAVGLPVLLALRAGPAGRRREVRREGRQPGRGPLRDRQRRAPCGLDCAQLPRRHRRRRPARTTSSPTPDRRRRQVVDWQAPGPQQRPAPLQQ